MQFTLTPEQAAAIGTAVSVGHNAAPVVTLHDHEDLRRIGLDLPTGTVEVRQGDGFCAITPNGRAIEST